MPLELLAQAEREKRIWNLVLGSIAGISLLVGGIGIMNIMLATVSERTREIGIRRALGATRTDIIMQFLIESTVLSAGGGLLGVFLGVGIPQLVSPASEIETVLSWLVHPDRLRHLGADRDRVRRLPRPPRRPDGPDRGPAAPVGPVCRTGPAAGHAAGSARLRSRPPNRGEVARARRERNETRGRDGEEGRRAYRSR